MRGPGIYDVGRGGDTIDGVTPWGRRDRCPQCGSDDVLHIWLNDDLPPDAGEPPAWVLVARVSNPLGHDRSCGSCSFHWASGRV